MSENTERRYLKWYNKIGYGSGDVAGNVVYAFLSSFVMIYLTDTVGLNPGIVGTLIAVSKLFDGITEPLSRIAPLRVGQLSGATEVLNLSTLLLLPLHPTMPFGHIVPLI